MFLAMSVDMILTYFPRDLPVQRCLTLVTEACHDSSTPNPAVTQAPRHMRIPTRGFVPQLLKIAELRHSPVGALTFGAELPIGKVAYPSAPTWIAYAGDHQRCLDQIPVAVSTATFCGAFLGQARVFRYYNAWVLAMLLEHSGRVLHTYPKVYFKASEFTTAGVPFGPLPAELTVRLWQNLSTAKAVFMRSGKLAGGICSDLGLERYYP